MSLAAEIASAVARNEAQLAKSIAVPTVSLDVDAQMRLQHFADYCKSVGVRPLPAAPATCAAFAKTEYTRGASADAILATLQDIEALHSNNNMANPVATTAVRSVLEEILHIEAPRSWPQATRPLFNSLPIEVRAVIKKRQDQNDRAVRLAQQEAADLRHKLEALQPKEIDSNGQVLKDQ